MFVVHQGSANTILVMGDSLSAAHNMPINAGWVALLERELCSNNCEYQVVNGSISGETTAGGLSRLPTLLEKYHPSVVILELGANDGLRGLALQQMEANLQSMIDLSEAAGAQVLLVGMHIPTNYGARYAQAFHATFGRLSQANGLPLVPFLLDGMASNRELFQADQVHPAAEAQPILLDNVLSELTSLVSCQLAEA